MTAVASGEGLTLLEFSDNRSLSREIRDAEEQFGCDAREGLNVHLQQARLELDEYFAGDRREFTVPLDLRGTAFQHRVWDRLLTIPFGTTRTYGEIARDLGDANATRAVGLANARNRVAIIVPCHRVIAANGTLWGYGGGVERKRWLLEHEGTIRRKTPLFAALP
jgi:AraC family transcriptional regulator of adaptative response/methylated-DNA-[protein]-cysteine methyltransferase